MISVVIPTLDPSSEMCRAAVESCGDVEVIVQHDEHRDGFAVTCNRGAKEAGGDVFVFVNDDAVLTPETLTELTFRQSTLGASLPGVISGGRLVYPDGRIQHTGVFLRRDPSGRLEAYNRRTEGPEAEVPAVTGALLAIGRSDWDSLGGFDESYVNGYEDVDLCLRHRTDGGQVWYVPSATAVHAESQSPHELRFGHAAHNIALLSERWGPLLAEVV